MEAERVVAPDPLADSDPVLIEDLERRNAQAVRRLRLRGARLAIDLSLVSVGLLVLGFWLLCAAVLVIPHMPGVLRPYTMTTRLLLLSVACLASGGLLLRGILRTRTQEAGHGREGETG